MMEFLFPTASPVMTAKKHTTFDRVLWTPIGLLGGFICISMFSEQGDLSWIGVVVGIVLLVLSALGVAFSWGPVVPCMMIGMLAASMAISPLASSHMEAALRDFGVPLVGSVIGLALGLAVEWVRAGPYRPPEE